MSDSEKPAEVQAEEVKHEEAEVHSEKVPDEHAQGDAHDEEPIDLGPTPRLKDYFQSPDSPSRYLMVLAALFALLAVVCLSLLVVKYSHHRHAAKKLEVVAPVIEKLEANVHQPLGQFDIIWDADEMTVSLSAEVRGNEIAEDLKGRDAEIRDAILPLLQNSSKEEVLTPTRQQHLRERITDQLNEQRYKGAIVEINFTDLDVEPHPKPKKK